MRKNILKNPKIEIVLWLIGIFVVATVFTGAHLPMLDNFGNESDEGIFLMTARLVNDGHSLYAEVFSDAGPIFTASLVSAFKIWGDSLVVGRGVMLAYALLTLLGVGILGYQLYGWLGGIFAAFMLSASQFFVHESVLVLRDTPSMSFALFALIAGVAYYKNPRKVWAVTAGLLFSMSLLTKFLFPAYGVILAFMLIFPHFKDGKLEKELWQSWLLFALAVLFPWAIVLIFVNPQAMFYQTFSYRFAGRPFYPEDNFVANLKIMRDFLKTIALWLPMTAFGLVVLARQKAILAWLPVAMFALMGAMLAVQSPLHPHVFVSLIPPIILLAAYGLSAFVNAIRQKKKFELWMGVVAGLAMLWGGIFGDWTMPKLVPDIPDNPPVELVKLLQAGVSPNYPILSDEPMLIYYAGRRVQLWLADASLYRFKTKAVTADDLIRLTQNTDIHIVTTASPRFPPEYKAWLADNFWVNWTQDGVRHFYAGRKVPARNLPANPAATFDNDIILDAVSIKNTRVTNNDWLQIDMTWHTQKPLADNYTVFAQLLDAGYQVSAQLDRPPVLNLFPTSAWIAGEGVRDRFFIPLPDDLSAGHYQLIVGMYHSDTGERAKITRSELPVIGDAVLAGAVEVKREE